jgi:transposase
VWVIGSAKSVGGEARLRDRVAALEAELAAAKLRADELMAERDRLREAYRHLELQLELQRRRLFVAKAERIDTKQLELEFAATLAKLNKLAEQLPADVLEKLGSPGGTKKPKRKPTGRRDLRDVDLPEERIVIVDPACEGIAARIDTEETCQIMWRRGGAVRVVTVRIKYCSVSSSPASDLVPPALDDAPPAPDDAAPALDATAPAADQTAQVLDETVPTLSAAASALDVAVDRIPHTTVVPGDAAQEPVRATAASQPAAVRTKVIVTAPVPPQILTRSIATASLLAHIVSDKLCDGLPLHRQEDRFARLGVRIDRGSMSRWLEDLGMIMGSSLVKAMRDDAFATAFCISTDATGVLVQPIPTGDKQRRACRRGHYFVQIADADHIFFEYTPKETSAAVGEMFRGYSGYIQADAKSVYDFLFRAPEQRVPLDDQAVDLAVRHELGCWSHVRTKFWEAAITKDVVARGGLARIARIFELDRSWRHRAHAEIKALRDEHLRPHVDAFFAWVAVEYDKVKAQRGFLRTAFGYAQRQHGPLTRFFDDCRLRLDNNASERALRKIAVGRKAWLFVGSDDHAQAAGNLMTLIASARLHGLDPEVYLRDVFRVFPYWPRDRYLELAPKYWLATRARLNADELKAELGPLAVPGRASSEQPAAC